MFEGLSYPAIGAAVMVPVCIVVWVVFATKWLLVGPIEWYIYGEHKEFSIIEIHRAYDSPHDSVYPKEHGKTTSAYLVGILWVLAIGYCLLWAAGFVVTQMV